MKKIILLVILLSSYIYAYDNYYYHNNKQIKITPYLITLSNNMNVTFYANERGVIFGISDKLLVKLKDNATIDVYLQEFNLILEKTLGTKLYLLKTKNKTLTLDISNRLNEKDNVKFAHPDFLKKIKRR